MMKTSGMIETPRLLIEPFSEKHLTDRYIEWLNDSIVIQYSDQRFKKHTQESCYAYLKSFEGTPNYFFALTVKESGQGHIGNITIYIDPNHNVADIGILIGEVEARGKGYATEAWLAVCDYLLRIVGIRKVTAGTIILNKPMINLMERSGMVPDGWRIRQCLWNGQEVDIIHSAFFRGDWIKKYPNGPFQK